MCTYTSQKKKRKTKTTTNEIFSKNNKNLKVFNIKQQFAFIFYTKC